jgi:rhombotail lipoprotein
MKLAAGGLLRQNGSSATHHDFPEADMHRRSLVCFLLLASLAAGCFTTRVATHQSSSALDFLYPQGRVDATTAVDVALHLPLRVGLAFAPREDREDPITEAQKQALLGKVAAAFKAHKGVGHLEVVPSVYLKRGGGFANLDQLSRALGLDLMVLLSYDQAQFTESTRASWTYLTVVGPLLIEGEKNDTRTVMDAVVYDIPSHALLFRAAGESTVNGSSSPLNESRKRRLYAGQGFDQATPVLIANLNKALAEFEEQAKNGTVRGPGTPAVAMYNPEGKRVNRAAYGNGSAGAGGGGGGGGAFGGPELLGVALLALALWGLPRRRRQKAS